MRKMTVLVFCAAMAVGGAGSAWAEAMEGAVAAHEVRLTALEGKLAKIKMDFADLTTAVSEGVTEIGKDLPGLFESISAFISELKKQVDAGKLVTDNQLRLLRGDVIILEGKLEEMRQAKNAARTGEKAEAPSTASSFSERGNITLEQLGVPNPQIWKGVPGLPGEDPIMSVVRPGCPDGTAPKYWKVGADERFRCVPIEELPPARKALRYLGAGALGAGAGVAGNYGLGRALGHDMTGKDLVMSGLGGAVLGVLIYYWAE